MLRKSSRSRAGRAFAASRGCLPAARVGTFFQVKPWTVECFAYIAVMSSTNHTPEMQAFMRSKLIEIFMEFCGDDYYAEFAPNDRGTYYELIVNREDGQPMGPIDIMTFHSFIVNVEYHHPSTKRLLSFDDFFWNHSLKTMNVIGLNFYAG